MEPGSQEMMPANKPSPQFPQLNETYSSSSRDPQHLRWLPPAHHHRHHQSWRTREGAWLELEGRWAESRHWDRPCSWQRCPRWSRHAGQGYRGPPQKCSECLENTSSQQSNKKAGKTYYNFWDDNGRRDWGLIRRPPCRATWHNDNAHKWLCWLKICGTACPDACSGRKVRYTGNTSQPLNSEKWNVTHSFTHKRSDLFIPIATVHLDEFAEVLLNFKDANAFEAVLDGLCSCRNLLSKAPTTDA